MFLYIIFCMNELFFVDFWDWGKLKYRKDIYSNEAEKVQSSLANGGDGGSGPVEARLTQFTADLMKQRARWHVTVPSCQHKVQSRPEYLYNPPGIYLCKC